MNGRHPARARVNKHDTVILHPNLSSPRRGTDRITIVARADGSGSALDYLGQRLLHQPQAEQNEARFWAAQRIAMTLAVTAGTLFIIGGALAVAHHASPAIPEATRGVQLLAWGVLAASVAASLQVRRIIDDTTRWTRHRAGQSWIVWDIQDKRLAGAAMERLADSITVDTQTLLADTRRDVEPEDEDDPGQARRRFVTHMDALTSEAITAHQRSPLTHT